MATYHTNFALTSDVTDISAARHYLSDEPMAFYLYGEIPTIADEDIIAIDWKLIDSRNGIIECEFARELTKDELTAVSHWIRGQCSDGLGEGFEQQDFAYQELNGECESCEYNEECEDNPVTCNLAEEIWAEFDWKTNDYTLRLS